MISILQKIKFWVTCNRLGPDIPLTHFLLYSTRLGKMICKRKFKKFGNNSFFRPFAYAIETQKITIGDNVVIRPGTMLFASPLGSSEDVHIKISDDVLIGSGVNIYVSNHSFSDATLPISLQGHSDIQPVILERGCWIGANVTILPGVTIGENSVVGANSLVTKSVPAFHVAVGNPAKVIKKVNE
ncbi:MULTISPECIES: acyltransferase [Citrobacter]|uniref:acyltransferase n=1 Tax=Citrobacter TaxID=544 RepID=UPI0015E95872|nr:MULTISPECIES: acyltransferase [Citrobacter]EHG7581698.1 acyltransferase [Citrobacter sedlakii]QMK45627.1 acyltransferase [Citrobacter sp. RHB21-C05]QMK64071.1 acyltransferase [Citrobacter sp. RHB21-C01]